MPAASSNRERRAGPHHYRFRVSPDLIGKLGQRGRGGHCVKGTFGSASPDPIASTNRQKGLEAMSFVQWLVSIKQNGHSVPDRW